MPECHAAISYSRPHWFGAFFAGAGGSVVCTSGFDAVKFFAWLEEFLPTWYTAVPTIHQDPCSSPP
jgi:hypothetical protein